MKVLKANNKSIEFIKTAIKNNPEQKVIVKDGCVVMNSLELTEEGGEKVKLRDYKNVELEIQCTDGNLFLSSSDNIFSITKPTELSKHSFILGAYEDDNIELKQQAKPKVISKEKFDNKPFKFR